MKQSTKRFLSMAGGLFFLVGAILIYVSFLKPAYDDIQQVKSEQMSRSNLIKDQQAAIKKVQDLIKTYQGQGQLQDTISAILPNDQDIPVVIAQMNGLIQNTGMISKSFSVTAAGLGIAPNATSTSLISNLVPIQVQARFSGTYEDFKNFLTKLETNIRIFDVKNISVSPVASNQPGQPSQIQGRPTYNFDLGATTYYQGQ